MIKNSIPDNLYLVSYIVDGIVLNKTFLDINSYKSFINLKKSLNVISVLEYNLNKELLLN
jgi:hypothetical protein